jgi:hypothetical protein
MASMNDRGQLILIAAVLIATTILGSVVLLNSIHASADTNAYKEGQSLDQANRVIEQVKQDLRALFLAEIAEPYDDGEPAGFVTDRVAFNNTVKNYSRQYTNVSSIVSSSILWVEYNNDTGDKNGLVLRQNSSGNDLTDTGSSGANSWFVVENTDTVPYMYFNFTTVSTASNGLRIELGTASDNDITNLSFDGSVGGVTIFKGPETICNSGSNPFQRPIEMVFRSGDGEIRANDRVCSDFKFGTIDFSNVRFKRGSEVQGNYTLLAQGSGTSLDPDFGSGSDQYNLDGVIVNPGFTIRYDGSNGNYRANTTAFGGGR